MNKKINDWRDVIGMPIVSEWSSEELEAILLEANFRCAVQCANDNHGHVFFCLSGGLDSSLSMAMARRFLETSSFHAFTIGGSPTHPDIRHAKMVTAKLKANHYILLPTISEIEVAKEEFVITFPDTVRVWRKKNIGTYLLLRHISQFNVSSIIVHDGIDELLGGYWEHRENNGLKDKKEIFKNFWKKLETRHLEPLEKIADRFKIKLIFPYLQKELVEYVPRIPPSERTSHRESKIPLRRIAQKYLPPEIVSRPKIGFCDALKETL
ncbi:MAG: asparagine synthase C-terminal domain-containing protein [Candidatus Portnoybacteria bacterium]|nr:asparagine synthase C-terminal domain-containing protein [Candidatus Portnoybacteria bacterium]